MAHQVESLQSLLEQVTYLWDDKKVSEREIGIRLAMLKVHSSRVMEFCAREAVQIFGGRGYIRGGIASRVERIYREVRVQAIAEGSEEILQDFFVRQSKL